MAEQITTSEKQGGNRKRMNKKSTRVDLTPMVDLGFLLITFFVFTTTMSTATAMGMVTPNDKTGPTNPVCESCVITVLPAGNNRVYYYEGAEENAEYKETNYSATGLRKLLVDKKNSASANHKDAVLIIKPGDNASFKNLVDIIDESTICMYKRYYLDKPNNSEEKHIQ